MDFKVRYFLLILLIINTPTIHAKDLLYLSELSRESSHLKEGLIFGVDGLYMVHNINGQYQTIFQSKRGGYNFYCGYTKNSIMLEIGYLATTGKPKKILLSNGASMLDEPVTATTLFAGKAKMKVTHFDLNFFIDFLDQYKVIVSTGIGFAHPHIKLMAKHLATDIVTTKKMIAKTSTVPKLGVGVYYDLKDSFNVKDHLLVRAMCYFDHFTNKTRFPGEPYNKPFGNSFTLLAGLSLKL